MSRFCKDNKQTRWCYWLLLIGLQFVRQMHWWKKCYNSGYRPSPVLGDKLWIFYGFSTWSLSRMFIFSLEWITQTIVWITSWAFLSGWVCVFLIARKLLLLFLSLIVHCPRPCGHAADGADSVVCDSCSVCLWTRVGGVIHLLKNNIIYYVVSVWIIAHCRTAAANTSNANNFRAKEGESGREIWRTRTNYKFNAAVFCLQFRFECSTASLKFLCATKM